MTNKGPTGWEVARAANVSQSTVSLVLSGRAEGRVSPETQERVRKMAKELGYRPHAAARSLRLGRSGLVLLVVPNVQCPFCASVLDGAERAAYENECSIVLGTDQHGAIITGAANAVDGMLVCSTPPPDPDEVNQLPMVVLNWSAPRGVPTIRLNVSDGMAQAAQRLIQLGHHRIGYLHAPPQRTSTSHSRATAFRRSTTETMTTVVNAEITVAAADAAAHELLTVPGPKVTAIICDDDVQAAGVYRAAQRLGMRIPDDLSVIGFGDALVSRLLHPTLTTVQLSGEELGRAGFAMLLDLLRGHRQPRRAVLPTCLVERESIGPPPAD